MPFFFLVDPLLDFLPFYKSLVQHSCELGFWSDTGCSDIGYSPKQNIPPSALSYRISLCKFSPAFFSGFTYVTSTACGVALMHSKLSVVLLHLRQVLAVESRLASNWLSPVFTSWDYRRLPLCVGKILS